MSSTADALYVLIYGNWDGRVRTKTDVKQDAGLGGDLANEKAGGGHIAIVLAMILISLWSASTGDAGGVGADGGA